MCHKEGTIVAQQGPKPTAHTEPYEFRVKSVPLSWVMYSPSQGVQWMRRTKMLDAQSESEVLAFLNDAGVAFRCRS